MQEGIQRSEQIFLQEDSKEVFHVKSGCNEKILQIEILV